MPAPGPLRIAIMVVVTVLVTTMLLSGPSRHGARMAGGLVLVFWAMPLTIIISILHAIAAASGQAATIMIALIGRLPALFFAVIAPATGVRGGLNPYAVAGSLSGLVWSAARILTA